MHHVQLSTRCLKDLRRIDHADRRRLRDLLERELAAHPQAPNLDIKQLVGRAPWLRLRRGDYRILYRPLSDAELKSLNTNKRTGFLVERIVDRGDLERAAGALGT